MNVTRLLSAPLSRGLALCILGFLIAIFSYFLLPFCITKVCNEYICPPLKSPTVGDFLGESFTSPPAPWLILGTLLPLIMFVAMLLLGLLYARWQQRSILHLFLGGWIVSGICLLALSGVFSIFYYPAIGFLGLMLGYAVFFGGYLTFLDVHIAASKSRMP